MGQTCTICNSSNRVEIDRELCRGKSYQKIANEFDVSGQAVRRHWLNGHVNYQLQTAMRHKDVLEGHNLLGNIDELINRTKALLDQAESGRQLNTALKGVGELRSLYDLLQRIAFSLHDAKLKEYMIERERSGNREREEEQEFWDGVHQNLNDAELHLLEKLIEKINGDTSIDVVEEYREPEEMEFLRSLERKEWKHEGKVTAGKHRPDPLDDLEEEPVPEVHDDEPEEPEPENDPRPECEKKMRRTKDPPKTSVERVLREFG